MRVTPVTVILIVLAIVFFSGGRFYNNGIYQGYGFGIGGILLVLFVLYLIGVL